MSSADLRYYLRYVPVKLALAVVLFGIDVYQGQGLNFDTVFIVIMAYGAISTFAFISRMLGNWLLGLCAIAIIFVIYFASSSSLPIWANLAIGFVLFLLGPVMDIVAIIMLIKTSSKERKETKENAAAREEYRDYIANREAREKRQSAADELMKYKSLLDSGAITQQEYEKKKKEILD